jgi:hypothetical protein
VWTAGTLGRRGRRRSQGGGGPPDSSFLRESRPPPKRQPNAPSFPQSRPKRPTLGSAVAGEPLPGWHLLWPALGRHDLLLLRPEPSSVGYNLEAEGEVVGLLGARVLAGRSALASEGSWQRCT